MWVRSLHRPQARALAAAVLVALALACTSVRPVRSWADGDPASDVLLAQSVFYPYQPKVGRGLEVALENTLHAAASAARLHLKVAIIGTPEELGLVPNFFGHPQAYARFLDREISFNQPQQLLVVMPVGFGVVPAKLASGLARVPVETRQRSDSLTRSAIFAVVALARSQGHPIPLPAIAPSKSNSSPPALLIFGLPVALLAVAGLALKRRGRTGRSEHPTHDDDD
jgi:hypothetical protein